jgi:hypothetical protein
MRADLDAPIAADSMGGNEAPATGRVRDRMPAVGAQS